MLSTLGGPQEEPRMEVPALPPEVGNSAGSRVGPGKKNGQHFWACQKHPGPTLPQVLRAGVTWTLNSSLLLAQLILGLENLKWRPP